MNANESPIDGLVEAARTTSNTFAKVYLNILKQSAQETQAAADLAALEGRLAAQRKLLELVVDHFDKLLATAAQAPALLRPALKGQVLQLASQITALSVEAGGEEQAIAGVLDQQIAGVFPTPATARNYNRTRSGQFAGNGHVD